MLGIDPRAARATWTVLLVLLLCLVVYAIRQTLFVFVVALLFAYLLLPVVEFIDRKLPMKRSRTPALAIVYACLVVLIVFVVVEVGSRAAEQGAALVQRVPELLKPEETSQLPMPQPIMPVSQRILGLVRDYIQEHQQEILESLSKMGLKAVGAAGRLIFIIIIPILSFFFLKDGRALQAFVLRALPDVRRRGLLKDIVGDLNLLLAQYMRALVLLGLATSLCYGIFFVVMGVPYGVLLAAIAFPLEFIPMVGPLISTSIILGVAGFSGYPNMLAIVIFLAAFRLFQDYVLQPHLMSSGIAMHPLVVIFGVFAGEQIAGFQGAFLSVPVLATLRIMYRRLILPYFTSAPADTVDPVE